MNKLEFELKTGGSAVEVGVAGFVVVKGVGVGGGAVGYTSGHG